MSKWNEAMDKIIADCDRRIAEIKELREKLR
jgi:hypothetical protein